MQSLSLRRSSLKGSLLLCGVALFAACDVQQPGGEQEQLADAEQAIQGGYTDKDTNNVVGIVDVNKGGICSGSLIGPNLVLTARHCVSNISNDSQGVICSQSEAGNPGSAGSFYVTTNYQLTQNPADYHMVQEVVITPGSDLLCGNDQAILILADNVAPEEAVPLVPRVDYKLAEGEEYNAVGYGQTGDNNSNSAGTRRRRDELFVYCAEDDCQGVGGYVTDEEWIGDAGICSGDSGGPAIDLQGRVVGVTSRGGPNCSNPVYGSVHSWGEWIKETGLYAAQLGGYPPPLWALGQPTDSGWNGPVGGNCTELACEVCWKQECTRRCISDEVCPDGYTCEEVKTDTNVCVAIPEEPPPSEETSGGSGDAAESTEDGCNVAADPTNPVPWRPALLGMIGLAALLRRRRRA